MSEFFRSTKLRLGALLIALLGIGVRYAENWIFDRPESVENSPVFPDGWSRIRPRTSTSPARQSIDANHSRWRIAVATNRSFGHDNPIMTAGMTRMSDQVQGVREYVLNTTYGFSDVTVPLNRTRGACCLDAEQPDHVIPQELQPTDSSSFHKRVAGMLQTTEVSDVMVFIHGFNVSLEQATARAAQLAEDMPFHGVMIAYSWASAAQQTGYATDSVVAERYFWNLAALLADLREQLPKTTRLHVLAHSMGNRVTLRALNALTGTIGPLGDDLVLNPDRTRRRFAQWGTWSPHDLNAPPLTNLILAAPDVEVHQFERFVTSLRHVSKSIVLYASNSDMALEGSLHFNGEGHRAGDSRAHIHVDGLRVINVSGVNKLDPLGHSYYGSNPGVLDQLARLVRPMEHFAQRPDQVNTAIVPTAGVFR